MLIVVKSFVDITLTKDNHNHYYYRGAIFDALRKNLLFLNEQLLENVCGFMYDQNTKITQYVDLDIGRAIKCDDKVQLDMPWCSLKMHFSNNFLRYAIASFCLTSPLSY